jgi:hypothetical protein
MLSHRSGDVGGLDRDAVAERLDLVRGSTRVAIGTMPWNCSPR